MFWTYLHITPQFFFNFKRQSEGYSFGNATFLKFKNLYAGNQAFFE
jgi:hypothetical protein